MTALLRLGQRVVRDIRVEPSIRNYVVALVTAYVYFDARTRAELAPRTPDELPAEVELRTG